MHLGIVNLRKILFSKLIWSIPTTEKKIYLTFDDGPTPGITPLVLSFLRQVNAKATFFCLGKQAELNPNLISQIKNDGHSIANHGYEHISGFTSSLTQYIKNVDMGAASTRSTLYRPPYGRITPRQIFHLKNKYNIVWWTCLSMDFNPKTSPEKCLKKIIKKTKPGAIIVFHDTNKAASNLITILPAYLKHLVKHHYQFETLMEFEMPKLSF
jgi:peptidoglycan-N-acetylglucosamine deacetylase